MSSSEKVEDVSVELSQDSTIVLDSSVERSREEFVPVKPGGKLLNDDTIEISDDEDDEEEDLEEEEKDVSLTTTTVSQDSRYVTSVQSPGQLSFNTPAMHSSAIMDREHGNRSNTVTLVQNEESAAISSSLLRDPFEVEDEFCRDDSLGGQIEEQKDSGVSATTSPEDLNASVTPKRGREEEEEEQPQEEQEPRQASLSSSFSLKRRRLFEMSELPKTCTVLSTPNGVVYLVGTAHFSKESNEDVAQVVRMTQPDAVLLELCPARTDILRLDEETLAREGQDMNATKMMQTIRSFGAVQGAMYLLMLSMSAKLTKELGMAPGGEFRAAFK